MWRFLGSAGPPWYREGIADLLATHLWKDGTMQINQIPLDKVVVPDWGRIKLIREAVQAGSSYTIREVMDLSARRFSGVDAYAWSWALCAFLDGHPDWRPAFRDLGNQTQRPANEFNGRLLSRLGARPRPVVEAWQLFLHELDYGYLVREDVITYEPCERTIDDRLRVKTSVGWQSTGVRVDAGRAYRIAATGRFALNDRPQPWMCEAGGVTIRYHRGRPLGMLMMAIRDETESSITALASPTHVGMHRVIRPDRDGVLFLRINEPAGQRADNEGELLVSVASAR